MASSRPLRACIWRTTSSMDSSASGGVAITRSGPSAINSSSSSVTRVAISTILSLPGSSPVISRSIQTSTQRTLSGAAWRPLASVVGVAGPGSKSDMVERT